MPAGRWDDMRCPWVLPAVLLLAGCGGDPEPLPTPEPRSLTTAQAAQVVAVGFAEASDPGAMAPLVSPEQATCFGEAVVKRLGVKGLVRHGVLTEAGQYGGQPRAAPPGVADTWAHALGGCLDLTAYMVGVTRVVAYTVGSLGASDDAAWELAARCVKRDVPPRYVRELLVAGLTGGERPAGPARTAFNRCVSAAAG